MVELGVAAGVYSAQLLCVHPGLQLWMVDRWDDHHDEAEMRRAAAAVKFAGSRARVCRRTFTQFLADWQTAGASGFDIVYLDGYAHTGQDNGASLEIACALTRPGGILAGHDYDPAWPACMEAVDAFLSTRGWTERLHVCGQSDQYKSWYVRMPNLVLDRTFLF